MKIWLFKPLMKREKRAKNYQLLKKSLKPNSHFNLLKRKHMNCKYLPNSEICICVPEINSYLSYFILSIKFYKRRLGTC